MAISSGKADDIAAVSPAQAAPPKNATGTGEGVKRGDVLRASPPMFKTTLIDRLTRVHPIVPVLIYVPAIGGLAYLASRNDVDTYSLLAWMFAGWVFWGLAEYWIHRLMFHFEPEDGIGARLHWMLHGVHHDHPNDPLRLVMPPSASIPLASLFVFGFLGLLGKGHGAAVGAGFLVGYLSYDMLHHHLHHHKARTGAGRWLRELHMRHHFQDDTTGFGISAPWWDVVFQTFPGRRRDHQ